MSIEHWIGHDDLVRQRQLRPVERLRLHGPAKQPRAGLEEAVGEEIQIAQLVFPSPHEAAFVNDLDARSQPDGVEHAAPQFTLADLLAGDIRKP